MAPYAPAAIIIAAPAPAVARAPALRIVRSTEVTLAERLPHLPRIAVRPLIIMVAPYVRPEARIVLTTVVPVARLIADLPPPVWVALAVRLAAVLPPPAAPSAVAPRAGLAPQGASRADLALPVGPAPLEALMVEAVDTAVAVNHPIGFKNPCLCDRGFLCDKKYPLDFFMNSFTLSVSLFSLRGGSYEEHKGVVLIISCISIHSPRR